jgi:hypothetical protein
MIIIMMNIIYTLYFQKLAPTEYNKDIKIKESRDSAVGIKNGYGLHDKEVGV